MLDFPFIRFAVCRQTCRNGVNTKLRKNCNEHFAKTTSTNPVRTAAVETTTTVVALSLSVRRRRPRCYCCCCCPRLSCAAKRDTGTFITSRRRYVFYPTIKQKKLLLLFAQLRHERPAATGELLLWYRFSCVYTTAAAHNNNKKKNYVILIYCIAVVRSTCADAVT